MKKNLCKFILCLTAAAISVVNASAQTKMKVSGSITDSYGPVIGAAVQEKGSSNGVITDMNGKYEIKRRPTQP